MTKTMTGTPDPSGESPLDALNRKLAAAGEGTQSWKAVKEGDQIAGRIELIGSFTHPEYGTSPTLTIDTDASSVIEDGATVADAGRRRILMAGAVLLGVFNDNSLKVGDWIALRYLGKKQTTNGTMSYRNYASVVEHPSAGDKLDRASDFT